ncbi:MAG: hydrogenase subunit MbhD domain-containing protein [Candidatus Thermoplasmatota archaeon]
MIDIATITDIGHIALLIMIVISGYAAIKFKDLIVCAIAAGIMSLLLSLEFYVLQAPDVAIAQAGIGAGLTTAIYIVAIRGTRREEED